MGKKNKGFPWFKGKQAPAPAPVQRTVLEIQQDYNNACVQLGDKIFKARLAQAQTQQHEQDCNDLLKKMFTYGEEIKNINAAQNEEKQPAPVPTGEGEATPTETH